MTREERWAKDHDVRIIIRIIMIMKLSIMKKPVVCTVTVSLVFISVENNIVWLIRVRSTSFHITCTQCVIRCFSDYVASLFNLESTLNFDVRHKPNWRQNIVYTFHNKHGLIHSLSQSEKKTLPPLPPPPHSVSFLI